MKSLIHTSRRFRTRRDYTYPELRQPEAAPRRRISLVSAAPTRSSFARIHRSEARA